MKFALIGAAAIAAAAFVTPALAQDVISNGSGNPHAGVVYNHSDNWRNATATQAFDSNAYRYHGGPKYND